MEATETTATEALTEWVVFSRALRITRKVTARNEREARKLFKAQYGANATSVLVER